MKIALLGIQARSTTPWCVNATNQIRTLDPTAEVWTPDDDAWNTINWTSGDAVQPAVDGILERQLRGIASCDEVLVCLGIEEHGLGARLELGRLLMTPGLRLHVILHPNLMGRHYIRAHFPIALATVREYDTITAAVQAIVKR